MANIITLRNGLLVTERAVTLALRLEDAGHTLTAREGTLLVGNGSTLTAEERAAIAADRWHLLAIAGHEAPC